MTDWWRIAYRRREVASDTLPERTDDVGFDPADRDALIRALAQLPRRQRTVVVLRYLEDMAERDVAATLGITVGTVKSTCHQALKRLRITMTDEPMERTP